MPQTLIDKKVELWPSEDGSFDEFVMFDVADPNGRQCLVYAEMISDQTLWIGFYPPGETERRVVMWISAKGDKLKITAEED